MTDSRSYGMCECGHHFSMHKESMPTFTALGPGFGDCKGYHGSATPGPFTPCGCGSFREWTGAVDARTGKPVKPLTLSTHVKGNKDA